MNKSSCIISTKRLCLRPWFESDLLPFIEMNKDPEVMEFFPNKLTEGESKEMLDRINLCFDKNNFGLYAVEEKTKGNFLGFTGFSTPGFNSIFTPCVEIGWRFKKESWGQGFATEAANACILHGFNSLGFTKIVSFTSALNKKSETVMKRIGMNYVADFNHPNIAQNNRLCRHVLYEIIK